MPRCPAWPRGYSRTGSGSASPGPGSPSRGARRARIALAQVGDEAVHVARADEHLAWLGALVAADHGAPLEHVDEPPGARVAQAQAALEHRRRRRAHLDAEADRVLEQGVLVGAEAVVGDAGGGLLVVLDLVEQVLAQLGLALAAPERRQRLDLRLVDVGALDALQPRRADRREEHVALAEQRLGAVAVEDHARVGLRGDARRRSATGRWP